MEMQAELERLKRQHAEREAQVNAERVAAAAAASVSSQGPVPSGATQPSPASHTGPVPDQEPPRMTEELLRSLKVHLQPFLSQLPQDTVDFPAL